MAAKGNASEEKRPKESSENRSKGSLWYDWLSHPLLLLLVGAVISSFLIPDITRRWQDHQKELELKTALVSQITDATTSTLTEAELLATGAETKDQGQLSARVRSVYQDWMIKGAAIRAELEAYFPGTLLSRDWFYYYGLVHDYYLLQQSGIIPVAKSQFWEAIRAYFDYYHIGIDWGAVEKDPLELLPQLRTQMDELIQRILNSNISTY